jgi:hypothetical protein
MKTPGQIIYKSFKASAVGAIAGVATHFVTGRRTTLMDSPYVFTFGLVGGALGFAEAASDRLSIPLIRDL